MSLHNLLMAWKVQNVFWLSDWLKFKFYNEYSRLLYFVRRGIVTIEKDFEVWSSWAEIGRAHVWTPVTRSSRMPSSAWKKKKKKKNDTEIYEQKHRQQD